MKIITIVHAEDGFETVEMEINDPDAVVMVNFVEGRLEVKNLSDVEVRDRDSGELLRKIINGSDCGGFGGGQTFEEFKNGIIHSFDSVLTNGPVDPVE